jgi:hypothetical protein
VEQVAVTTKVVVEKVAVTTTSQQKHQSGLEIINKNNQLEL